MKTTNIIAIIMIVHALSGAVLTFVKNPYGSSLDVASAELLAGVGLLRARKATTNVEKKVDDLE